MLTKRRRKKERKKGKKRKEINLSGRNENDVMLLTMHHAVPNFL